MQGLGSKGSSGILPSSRELVLPSMQASGSGDGLQISLDLNEVHEDDGEDDWEDVDHLKTSGSQEQDKVQAFPRQRFEGLF